MSDLPRETIDEIAKDLNGRDFSEFLKGLPSMQSIESWLEQLDAPADAKSVLLAIAKTTAKVGQTIVAVGRKVIETVRRLFEAFPNTAFGVVVSVALGALIASIPIIGALIGPLATKLLLIFNIASGSFKDMREREMQKKMQFFAQEYAILRT